MQAPARAGACEPGACSGLYASCTPACSGLTCRVRSMQGWPMRTSISAAQLVRRQHVQLRAHGKGCISYPGPNRSDSLQLAALLTRAGGLTAEAGAGFVCRQLCCQRSHCVVTAYMCRCVVVRVLRASMGARRGFAAGCVVSPSQTCQRRRHKLGCGPKELLWPNLVLGRGFAAVRADMRGHMALCALLFFLACDQPVGRLSGFQWALCL